MKFKIKETIHRYMLVVGLKEEIKKTGMSMREVARKANISAAYLCDISHGRRYLNEKIKNKLIQILSDRIKND